MAAIIAELEHAEAALVSASGMGVITTAVLALVSAGDGVIGQVSTYGGVSALLQNLLPRLGVATTQVDQTDLDAFAAAMTPSTRLVLVESPSNPLLQVTDLQAVADLAHTNGALTLADNTVATPANQRPLELGIDLVWHSATKYLNGHSDVTAGVLAGSEELVDRVWKMGVLTGATLGPFDAWLLLRGLRTFPLRMARHNANGLALAEALSGHPAVAQVYYPGLTTDPGYGVAARQMTGFGGVVGVELAGGYEAAAKFLSKVGLRPKSRQPGQCLEPGCPSRGDVGGDALRCPDRRCRYRAGLVRFSAGIEETADLVEDALQALDSV